MHLRESYWAATDDAVILESTAGDSLRAAAAAVPDKVALIEGIADPGTRRRWTYAQLFAQAERMARALLGTFKPGDHVAVWAPNCVEWVVLQFGLALAGMVLVTVNPAYRRAELEYVLEQSRACGIFLTMQEYFDMPEATAKTLDAEGWLHTGDLCSMDERGYCYVQGRLKDMIIRGGENIYPREIEDVLFRHPLVAEIAVVGIPDQRWGEQVAVLHRAIPDSTSAGRGAIEPISTDP